MNNEKVFRTMGKAGGGSLTMGILTLVFGITTGVLMIVHGVMLLKNRKDLTF